LAANPRVSVYLLSSFPKQLWDTIRNAGATPILVKEQTEICQNVYSTGGLGAEIKEQSLVLRSKSGLAVITGCAHPGIVTILRHVKSALPSSADILIAMGGFHLIGSARFERIAEEIDAVGVRYIAPCHCTGKAAKRYLRKQFKERFVPLSAGVRLMLSGRVGKPCAETTCVEIPGR
jgi:7,8-dihydropterin-6-yl-methyl-4-(beta-D-ribofuranosyl)aminobenzene 5'-phosphate synthase